MKGIIEKTKNGCKEYGIENWLTGNRIINLFGEVNDVNVNSLIQQIVALNIENEQEITLLINSAGGNINQGLALCDVMELSKAPIRTVAIGTVASMASIIFMSGAKGKREVLPSAKIMLHDPRVIGNAGILTVNDAVELGKNLKNTKEDINKRIAKMTGRKLSQVNKDTSYDHYFTAEEAIAYGMADKIVESL